MGERISPGRAFDVRSKDVPLGAFLVSALPFGTEIGDEINPSLLAIIFEGDGSLAGDLLGPEIAKRLRKRGYNVGIIFNSDECSDMNEPLKGEEMEAG